MPAEPTGGLQEIITDILVPPMNCLCMYFLQYWKLLTGVGRAICQKSTHFTSSCLKSGYTSTATIVNLAALPLNYDMAGSVS